SRRLLKATRKVVFSNRRLSLLPHWKLLN
ncbi:hypothetical protein RKD37_000294, partial [Streptomyces ambofaciens]